MSTPYAERVSAQIEVTTGAVSKALKFTGPIYQNFQRPVQVPGVCDVIKGIGESTAGRILSAGFFKTRPKNWSSFVGEIKDAQLRLRQ